MKPGHRPAARPPSGREKSGGNGQLAAIVCWAVLMLAAAPAERAQGAGQAAKEGGMQSPVPQNTRSPEEAGPQRRDQANPCRACPTPRSPGG